MSTTTPGFTLAQDAVETLAALDAKLEELGAASRAIAVESAKLTKIALDAASDDYKCRDRWDAINAEYEVLEAARDRLAMAIKAERTR